ncbi:MAG: hypothetical protein SOH60_12240, partial [Lachnospiraceae bacterium]
MVLSFFATLTFPGTTLQDRLPDYDESSKTLGKNALELFFCKEHDTDWISGKERSTELFYCSSCFGTLRDLACSLSDGIENISFQNAMFLKYGYIWPVAVFPVGNPDRRIIIQRSDSVVFRRFRLIYKVAEIVAKTNCVQCPERPSAAIILVRLQTVNCFDSLQVAILGKPPERKKSPIQESKIGDSSEGSYPQ